MSLFENIALKVLNEDFEKRKVVDRNGNTVEKDELIVYHGARNESYVGISDKGFERYFTNSNGGNMYGAGVYTTYKLAAGYQNANGTYGSLIYKSRVKSLRSFIIYDPEIAKRVYRNHWRVADQLTLILTTEEIARMQDNHSFDFHKLVNSRQDDMTSTCALDMTRYFEYYDRKAGFKINGYIYKGSRDGYVCLVNDFKNIEPFEVSRDFGRTWEPLNETNNFNDFMKNDVDLYHKLHQENYELTQNLKKVPLYFVSDFAVIENYNDKFNFLYKKRPLKDGPISKVWFDSVPDTFDNKGECVVTLGDDKFILKLNKNSRTFYVFNIDGKYICKLDELPYFLNDRSQGNDADDEDDLSF